MKKNIHRITSIILSLAVIGSSFGINNGITKVRAEDYNGTGGGSVNSETGGLMNFNIYDQGYRIYFIDSDGKVVSRILDLVYNDLPSNIQKAENSTKFGSYGDGSKNDKSYKIYKVDEFMNMIGYSGSIPFPVILQGGAFYGNGKELKTWMLGDGVWSAPSYTPPVWVPDSSSNGSNSNQSQGNNSGKSNVEYYSNLIDSTISDFNKQAIKNKLTPAQFKIELDKKLYETNYKELLSQDKITVAEYNKLDSYRYAAIKNWVKVYTDTYNGTNVAFNIEDSVNKIDKIINNMGNVASTESTGHIGKIINYLDTTKGEYLFNLPYISDKDDSENLNPAQIMGRMGYKICIEPLIWLQPTRMIGTGYACQVGETPGVVPLNGKYVQGCRFNSHIYGTVTNLMEWLSYYKSYGYSTNNGTYLAEFAHGGFLSPVAVQSLMLEQSLTTVNITTGQTKTIMDIIPRERTVFDGWQLGEVLDKSNSSYPGYRYGYAIHVYGPDQQANSGATHTWDRDTQECITSPCKAPVPPEQPYPDGEGPEVTNEETGEKVKVPDYKFNIVKYYEDRHKDLDGNITDTDRSNHVRENNPPTIQIENEDVYKLEDWYTSIDYHKPSNPNEDYYETKSGLSKNQSGEEEKQIYLNPDYETTLYILLVKEDKPKEEVIDEGKLIIEESQITKGISTEEEWLGKLDFTFVRSAFPSGCHTIRRGKETITCCPYMNDNDHSYLIENTADIDNKLQAETGDEFDVKYHNNSKSGTSSFGAVSNSLNGVYRESVLWRGNDELTLNNYIKTGKEDTVNKIVNRIGYTPKSQRQQNNWYEYNLHLLFDRVSGEYMNSYAHSDCSSSGSGEHTLSNKVDSNSKVTVKVYRGKRELKSIGDQHITGTLNTAINISGNTTYHASGKQVQLSPNFTFYPYIRMTYQVTGQYGYDRTEVNVLSQHDSTIEPNSFAEAGWYNANEESSLRITSQQWSLHARAIEAYGKNNVLPGGAIHSLDIPEPNQSKVALVTWQPIMTGAEKSALTTNVGNEYSVSIAESEHNKFVDTAIKVLENWNVVQWVNKNPNASKAWETGGLKVYGNGESLSSLGVNTISSTEDKYYMKSGSSSEAANEGDLDIINNSKSQNMYYKIFADTKGDVYLANSTELSSLEGIHEGNQGNSQLLFNKSVTWKDVNSKLSGLAKEIDDRTQAVTNLVKALERNTGEDRTASWAKNDGKWYNEAFAVYMVRQCNTLTVGFKTPDKRTSALDPRLTPTNLGQADLFSKFFVSQYRMDSKSNAVEASNKEDGYISTFRGTDIRLKDAENLYQSRKFWIPNINVQDLY